MRLTAALGVGGGGGGGGGWWGGGGFLWGGLLNQNLDLIWCGSRSPLPSAVRPIALRRNTFQLSRGPTLLPEKTVPPAKYSLGAGHHEEKSDPSQGGGGGNMGAESCSRGLTCDKYG